MKNNKFYIAALSLSLLFASTSCSNDYLDINDNPNAIQAELLTPELMLAGATSSAYRTQATTMMQFGNLMMNSWAGNSYTFGGPFQREFNLGSVDSNFYTGIWGLYPRIANYNQIEIYPNADHKQDKYVAIGKIMKVFYMQYIVDLYGDVPYSEAFKGMSNTKPKYDNDEDIYKSLITKLEEANALMDANNPEALNVTSDIVFQGDMQKWKGFSNTLMLRLLVRMSKVTGNMQTLRDAKLQSLATRISNTANGGFVESEVIVNPGYSNATDDQMNPYILNWARTSGGTSVQNYSLVVVSEHMANALEGNIILNDTNYNKFNGLKDPRRTRLFTSVDAGTYTGLKGVRQGAVPGQPGAPTGNTNTSKLGIGNFSGSMPLPNGTWDDVIDNNNARGGVLMSVAESNLLQAEAALRWPSVFSAINAQAKFTNALTSNGIWIGVSTTAMNTYLASIATRPGLGWVGTNEQKLEALMTQKWITLTNVNPTEMFIEYNRTGMPYTPMATTAQYPNKPYRLMYPFSEFSANTENVPNITSPQLFVKNQYTPFWNQN